VWLESQSERRSAETLSIDFGGSDDGLMPAMDAIEVADGDSAAAQGRRQMS
jgi:hypothetical protein